MGKIIAIVGMCGSGKSIASDILVDKGYKKVYFGGVTMNKIKEAGLIVNPENEKMMREKLRSELGMAAFAIVLLPEISSLSADNNVVLDGLYSWDELKVLKQKFNNLKVISIICDKKLRYERLTTRSIRPLTNEEAEKRDIAEIENLAKGGPIAFADYFLDNNGNIEQYKEKLLKIEGEIK